MKTTTAHATTATGITGAGLIVLQYVLATFAHMNIPTDVASAAIILISPIIHVMITHGTTTGPNSNNPGD